LKIRYALLKSFTNLCHQKHIDCAFDSCCILHNILLEHDGYLDIDLPDYPGGLAATLKTKFDRSEKITFWNRGVDKTPDLEEEEAERRRPIQESTRLAQEWQTVMQALMNHYCFN
jgi:hypothetical protein